MRDRLTKRAIRISSNEEEVCCVNFMSRECKNNDGHCEYCLYGDAVWDKLADYEDLGTVEELSYAKSCSIANALELSMVKQELEKLKSKAYAIANNAIYFNDNSDYLTALYEICTTINPNSENIGKIYIDRWEE